MSSQSKVSYIGDGGTGPYTVPFSYLDKAHVAVSVDGVDVAFSWVGAASIQLGAAASGGAVSELRRDTPSATRLVDFTDGSVLTEADLDNALLQQLYIAQEVVDRVGGLLGKDALGQFDATGARIANLADPTAAQDAASKAYVDVTAGAAASSAAAAAASETAAASSASAAGASASAAASSAASAASAASAVGSASSTVSGRATPVPRDFTDAALWELETASGVSASAGSGTDAAESFIVSFAGSASDSAQYARTSVAGSPEVAAGQRIRFSVWASHTGSPNDMFRLTAYWRNSAFALLSTVYAEVAAADVPAGGGWVTLTATAPADVRKAQIVVSRQGTDTTGTWRIGAVRAEVLIDGDVQGPTSSAAGNLPIFAGVDGAAVADSGLSAETLSTFAGLKTNFAYSSGNLRTHLRSLKVSGQELGLARFNGAYRERTAGKINWYFQNVALTLAPQAFSREERLKALEITLNYGVVQPRKSSKMYGQYAYVRYASGKVFFANASSGGTWTTAASEPSDSSATSAGDIVEDGDVRMEFTGVTLPTSWNYALVDIADSLGAPFLPDSNDAYAGMLLAAVEAAAPSDAWLNAATVFPDTFSSNFLTRMEVLDLVVANNMTLELQTAGAGKLARTFQGGVNGAGGAYTIQFLADNVEVWRGYRAQAALHTQLGNTSEATAASGRAADLKNGIISLWDANAGSNPTGRFKTFASQTDHGAKSGDSDFVANFRFHLWPLLHGMWTTRTEQQTYVDPVIQYTKQLTPNLWGVGADLAGGGLDPFVMGEWFYAMGTAGGHQGALNVLLQRAVSRSDSFVVVSDAALALAATEIALQVTDHEVRLGALEAGSGAAASVDVTLAGSHDYLSLSDQQITLGPIDLSTDVTGTIDTTNIADDAVTPEKIDSAQTFTFAGLNVNEYIRHNGDTDTYIRFLDDDILLYAGGDLALTSRVFDGVDYVTSAAGVYVSGELSIPEYLGHFQDPDTYLRFSADRVRLAAGGASIFDTSAHGEVTIADDASVSVAHPDVANNAAAYVMINQLNGAFPALSRGAVLHVDIGSSPAFVSLYTGTATTVAAAARTGADGTNGQLNIGVQNGALQLENRTGGPITLRYSFFNGWE